MCNHTWIYVGSEIVECSKCKEKQSLWKDEHGKFVYLYKLLLVGADVSPFFQGA